MGWENWCIDATMGVRDGMLCCCPVTFNEDGSIESVVTGMNFIGNPPGKIVCIVHEGGNDEVEKFYAANKGVVDDLLAENKAARSRATGDTQ